MKMQFFTLKCGILATFWSKYNVILNAAVSFCRFPVLGMWFFIRTYNETILIQKQHFFEIRLIVVNILIHIRRQYSYDIK